MCFSIYKQSNVRKLCMAARNVQQIIDDGTLPEAFNKNRNGEAHRAVVAFDVLATTAAAVIEEQKDVSPFLRYRREVLADGDMAKHLRALLFNLWGGRQGLNLSLLFMNADEHHTRIALEMITSYTRHGENDPQFMALAAEIRDMECVEAAS